MGLGTQATPPTADAPLGPGFLVELPKDRPQSEAITRQDLWQSLVYTSAPADTAPHHRLFILFSTKEQAVPKPHLHIPHKSDVVERPPGRRPQAGAVAALLSRGNRCPPQNRGGETPCRARGSAPALWGTPAHAAGPTRVWLEERAHEQRRGAAAGLLRGETPPPMSARHRKHWRLKVRRRPSGRRCFTLGCAVSLTEGLPPSSHSSPCARMPRLQCHRPRARTPCPSPHPLPMTVLVTREQAPRGSWVSASVLSASRADTASRGQGLRLHLGQAE